MEAPSPHFDNRPDGTVIDTIVLHATVLNTLEEVIKRFQDPGYRVSAHYTIDRDGTVVQHVKEAKRAWHAGPSRMPEGREVVNDFSIGIELVNRNNGWDPYPDEQVDALNKLISEILNRHPIRHIVTHAQIAQPQGRKSDPLGFDMAWIKVK